MKCKEVVYDVVLRNCFSQISFFIASPILIVIRGFWRISISKRWNLEVNFLRRVSWYLLLFWQHHNLGSKNKYGLDAGTSMKRDMKSTLRYEEVY